MNSYLLSHEADVRLTLFLGMFAVIALWEAIAPRRHPSVPRMLRWPSNLGIVALNTAVLRFAFPVAAIGTALNAERHGWGLFGMAALPDWLAICASVVVLDFAIYFQHRLFHAVPILWRLHRMHHADIEFDVTTAIRFHPIEIVLSMLIKMGVVIALGAPPVAVLIFELALNATAMFNHGNVTLPLRIDNLLRRFLVTPDMHRIHHSVLVQELNSNFGFNLPWWDRLFSTYRPMPIAAHETMRIGLDRFRAPRELLIDRLLTQPFRSTEAPCWLDIDRFAEMNAKDDAGILVTDVRSAGEFAGSLGHIVDAINLPIDKLPGCLSAFEQRKRSPVVLVCRTDKRSASAEATLRDAGFQNVRVLRGGMELWHQRGLPTAH